MTTENHSDWARFFNGIWNFPKDLPADAVFIHGMTDLSSELIQEALRLYKTSNARYMVLNGEDHYAGGNAPGYEFWKSELIRHGLPEEHLQSIRPGRHTSQEAKAFVGFVQERQIASAYIVATPMHIMRAYLNHIEELKSAHYVRRFYPATIHGIDWEQSITIHSLANATPDEPTTRLGRLVDECIRIAEYRRRFEAGEEYPIASIREGLQYLASLQ